jgi:hypothetical protein
MDMSAPENIDPALVLTAAAVFLRIRVSQLRPEQQNTPALECLPVFGFRDLVR